MLRLAINLCMAALLCLVIVGCALPDRDVFARSTPRPTPTPTPSDDLSIPFETIATNDFVLVPAVVDLNAPVTSEFTPLDAMAESEELIERRTWLALVTASEEALPIKPYLSPEQHEVLATTDFTQNVAVVLFGGSTSGGSDRVIDRIATDGQGLLVHVVNYIFEEGVPDSRYPSQIVRILRSSVPLELGANTPLTLTQTQTVVPVEEWLPNASAGS